MNDDERSIQEPFYLHGLSKTGREHLLGDLCGAGNQDCYGMREVDNGTIMVVADGCGSTPDSATGSKAAVRVILETCSSLLAQEEIPDPQEFFDRVEQELLSRIQALADALTFNGNSNKILYQSCLFTTLVAVITPRWTAIAGCGDGVYAVNDSAKVLAARAGNQPAYLAYRLFDPVPEGCESDGLTVHTVLDTADLRSVFIGTDGVIPAQRGRETRWGTFSLPQLWQEESLYQNPAVIDEIFDELTCDDRSLSVKRNGADLLVYLDEKRSRFHDDTTFVFAVRNLRCDLPSNWNRIRWQKSDNPHGQEKCEVQPVEITPTEPKPAVHLEAEAETVTAVCSAQTALQLMQKGQEIPMEFQSATALPRPKTTTEARQSLLGRVVGWIKRILSYCK